MNEHEREDFRQFCRQANNSQVEEIEKQERERAKGRNPYYIICHEIALSELRVRRGY
jgi:hypothetical protein